MNLIRHSLNSLRKFHRNEKGLEALQVVMIIAIAAVCLIVVNNKWDDIRSWFNDMIDEGTGEDNWKTTP